MTTIKLPDETAYVVVSRIGRGRADATLVALRADALRMTRMQRRSGIRTTMRAVTLGGFQSTNSVGSSTGTNAAMAGLLARQSEHIEHVLLLDPTNVAALTPDNAVAEVLRKSLQLHRWCERVRALRKEQSRRASRSSASQIQAKPP